MRGTSRDRLDVTAGRPTWRTPGCFANGTTPRSTTASASSATPPADGTPTAPTAPRSWYCGDRMTTRSSRERGEARRSDALVAVGAAQAGTQLLLGRPSGDAARGERLGE